MSDLIGAARILAENTGSVPVFLDPPLLVIFIWEGLGTRLLSQLRLLILLAN